MRDVSTFLEELCQQGMIFTEEGPRPEISHGGGLMTDRREPPELPTFFLPLMAACAGTVRWGQPPFGFEVCFERCRPAGEGGHPLRCLAFSPTRRAQVEMAGRAHPGRSAGKRDRMGSPVRRQSGGRRDRDPRASP